MYAACTPRATTHRPGAIIREPNTTNGSSESLTVLRSRSNPAARELLEIARSVLGDMDVDRVLDRVLESARELTGARDAALGVLNESRTALAPFITVGIDQTARTEIRSEPTGKGVLGELIRGPLPLRLADIGGYGRSYGLPASQPPIKGCLGVPVLIGGEPFGNLYVTDKHGGGEFSAADQESLELLAEFAGLAIDHARRYAGSEARRNELQRTVDTLEATVQISRALGGQTDLGAVLELVAKRGRALVSARALVIELARDGNLEIAAAAGELARGLIGVQLPLRGSVADAVMRTGRTQRLEDELNRIRFNEYGLGRLGFDVEGGLIVPLVFNGRFFGVLIAVDRLERGPRFTAEDERLLESFAASAATAVATAQALAVERRSQRLAVAEQERARWARELHDETLQGLAALRLGLSAARRAGSRDALQKAVETTIGQLEQEISGLRALITELRPPELDQLGPTAAIEALADRVAKNGLDVDVHVDLAQDESGAARRHTSEVETTIYRIVQEALNNAVKNGHARRGVVEVIERETTIEVVVRDDGVGFDAVHPTEGFGLLGMRERTELLHGTLAIESAPGQGTMVRAELPVQVPAEVQSARSVAPIRHTG
jgi:signal transduction histidine kinase